MPGCTSKESKYARDCYHFFEEPDMGAHIPYCTSSAIDTYDPPFCNKKCPFYISNSDVSNLVAAFQKEKYKEEKKGDSDGRI